MSLLSLHNVRKAFGGVPALQGVELEIGVGEIHALMGENGAGKSTLIKVLAGVVAPDAATITLDGQEVQIDNPARAYELGLRFLHQELSFVPALSVAENIYMGRAYPKRAGVLVDWRRLNATARGALENLGITHIDPRTRMAELSVGDKMLVRIAGAFLSDPETPARLYVMDEPTAALTREESERLFVVLREIRKSGGSVLYVSHRLDEVVELCDRATVLRDGKTIDSGRIGEITHDDLVSLMIGRQVQEAYPPATSGPSDDMALDVRSLSANGLRPVSFSLRKGEILGIAGLSGNGQQALLRALFGDLPMRKADIVLDGAPYRPNSPADAWRRGLAYVPRERRSEGLLLTRPIFENITLAHLAAQSRAGTFLNRRDERRFAGELGKDVKLRAASTDQLSMQLSGGNQQKVVFARALSGNPRLLLLDEPTRGVDVGAKFDIYTLIRNMTAKDMAVIMVSSDLPELLGMCDRIAVMREGEITEILPAAGLLEDELINRCYGRMSPLQDTEKEEDRVN